MLTLPVLDGLPGVRHGFFTRAGGVSEGVYASLNCGWGARDDPARVAENRARAARRLGVAPEALATVRQVHGVAVHRVEGAVGDGEGRGEKGQGGERRREADALATRTPGRAIAVLTADCAPVLLADAGAGVVGAAHAGWRGALAGVVEAAVAAMEELGARREEIVAAIGPCIGRRSYEVGPEFPAPFTARDPAAAAFFAPVGERFRFDLEGYVADRLRAAGLADVQAASADTCADERRFFSHRRARLRGEPGHGHGLSAIALSER